MEKNNILKISLKGYFFQIFYYCFIEEVEENSTYWEAHGHVFSLRDGIIIVFGLYLAKIARSLYSIGSRSFSIVFLPQTNYIPAKFLISVKRY